MPVDAGVDDPDQCLKTGLSVSFVTLQICLDGLPFVIGTFKRLQSYQTCFLLLIEELYYHIITLVAVEYNLQVAAHRYVPESQPTVTNLVGRDALAHSFNTGIMVSLLVFMKST
jgi:hypothetical protein